MLCTVVVVHMRPRAMPLAIITMRKSIHGFPFLSYTSMGLRYDPTLIPNQFCLFKVFNQSKSFKTAQKWERLYTCAQKHESKTQS